MAQGATGPGFGITEAVEAMARALRRNDKLVVICLGSATNIAATLTNYPEYRTKIEKVTKQTTNAGRSNVCVQSERNWRFDTTDHHGSSTTQVVFVGGRSSCPDKSRHKVCKHFNVGRKNPQHLPDLNFEKDAAAAAALVGY